MEFVRSFGEDQELWRGKRRSGEGGVYKNEEGKLLIFKNIKMYLLDAYFKFIDFKANPECVTELWLNLAKQ